MKPFFLYAVVACVILGGVVYTALRSGLGPTEPEQAAPEQTAPEQTGSSTTDASAIRTSATDTSRATAGTGGFSPRLVSESRDLMPAILEGVHLGMTERELTQLRAQAKPSIGKSDEDKYFLEEKLTDGLQVLYGLASESKRLVQVQVMSVLAGTQAIKPHLDRMKARYGENPSVWDCPDTGGVPTRRFTWKKDATTIADVYLVHPGGVSLTLYVASNAVIDRSLADGRCAPVPAEQMNAFPVVTPEMLQRVGAR